MKLLTYILTIAAVLLIVVGLLLPPMGVIDGSVLTAVGELFAFAALATIWHGIEKGVDAKLTHGNTTINIESDGDDD